MTEPVLEKLARFAVEAQFKDLPRETVQKVKIHLLDTLGCAIGGCRGDASQIMVKLVKRLGGKEESTVIGEGKTSIANAALANGAMARYLDYSDVWASHLREVVHAGEAMVPTALAVGECEHLSGEQVLLAIALGYDISMRLAETPLKRPTYGISGISLGSAGVAGKLLDLNLEQMMSAMAISGLRIIVGFAQMFRGEVAMNKNIGEAMKGRDAVIAALLAKDGFTGAPGIFEGASGFCEMVGGCDLDALYRNLGKRFKIDEAWIKPYPSQYSFHTALDVAIKLVKEHQIASNDIAEVSIRTFLRASQAATPALYRPSTPELAEFSLPFCMALAIARGNVLPDYFTEQTIGDPELLKLAAKVRVELDPKLDQIAFAPGIMARPAIVEILMAKGERYTERLDYPKGHFPQNPFSQDDLESKCTVLASKLFKEDEIREMISLVDRFERLADVGELMELCTRAN